MLQIGRSLVQSQMVSQEFFIDIKSYRSYCGPGVDLASNRNECQEHFLWVKAAGCVRLTTLQPSYAVVMKSGNLNFLEPSGPLQACNGSALPFIGGRKYGSLRVFSSCLIHSTEVVIYYCDPSNETDPIFIYDFTDSFNVETNNCRILELPASKSGQNSSSELTKK